MIQSRTSPKPISPADRMRALPQQFFAQLVNKAETLRQEGHDVINLGQGNPDQATPENIVSVLQSAAMDSRYHKYIPFSGLQSMKAAVAAWYHARHGVTIDPARHVAILIGSKIGLQELSLALLNPGDRAMVPDPGYPDYWSGIRLAGADMISLPLEAELNFLPDLSHWDPKAKLAFFNYPNNPTGRLASGEFFDELINLADRDGITLAHDLAYGDITFDGKQAVSLLSRPGGIEAGIEFTTVSKSYNMAGWRLGFAVGNPEIIHYLELLQDHLHCSQFGAIQQAGIEALTGPQDSVKALVNRYQSRRDAFINETKKFGWQIPPSEGSIFMWCPVPTKETATEFAERVLAQEKVVLAPGTGFGRVGEGYVRISLTASTSQLIDAAQRIGRLL
jgi:aminotransferase